MKLGYIPVSTIIEDPRCNPLLLESKTDSILLESITSLGIVCPIIIDEQNRLLDGYRRLFMARQLGMSYVPVRITNGPIFTSMSHHDPVKLEAWNNIIQNWRSDVAS